MFKKIRKQIKAYFALVNLAKRRTESLCTTEDGYYKTKKELTDHISQSVGSDWKNISEILIEPHTIKIVRYYNENRVKCKNIKDYV